jgi:hypothetical protein
MEDRETQVQPKHFLLNETITPPQVYEHRMHDGHLYVEGLHKKDLGPAIHIHTAGQDFSIPDNERYAPPTAPNPFMYTGLPELGIDYPGLPGKDA